MNIKGMLLSLLSWLVFSIVGQRLGAESIGWASAAALLVAVISLIRGRRGGVKLLDVAAVVTFGLLTVVAFVGGPATREMVADYGRGGCAVILGLVMAISLITVPFTEAYARETVPQQYWSSPTFRAVNRKISAIWAVIVLAMAGGHLLNGHLAATSPTGEAPQLLDILLNWVVPIGLIAIGAVLTKRIAASRPTSQPADESTTQDIIVSR